MSAIRRLRGLLVVVPLLLSPSIAEADQVAGIRVTQTGGSDVDVEIDVDVTIFYRPDATEASAYMGTYYNTVPALDWGDGATVSRYGYGPSTGIPVVATSTVVNGIPARAFRGSFSHTYGAVGDYRITANTRCCPVLSPTNSLVSGTVVNTTVATSGPFGPTTFTTSFVQNATTVEVINVPPLFDKVFGTSPIIAGSPTPLTFTIDNTGNSADASDLAFADHLPIGLVIADSTSVSNTCGGTVTAVSGSGTLTLAGGSVASGATCTIQVDATATITDGTLVNISGDLTSSLGNSGAATDTLEVWPPEAWPLRATMRFRRSPIGTGQFNQTSLELTIENTDPERQAAELAFTSELPAGLLVVGASDNTCGGTVTAIRDSSTISLTGGTVAMGSSCTIAIAVFAAEVGQFVVTTGHVTSSLGNGMATSTLVAVPLAICTLSFSPDTIRSGETSRLTLEIDNSANSTALTNMWASIWFSANSGRAYPDNSSTTCDMPSIFPFGGSVGTVPLFRNAMVPANSTCAVSFDVFASFQWPVLYSNAHGTGFSSDIGRFCSLPNAKLNGIVGQNVSSVVDVPTSSGAGLALLAGLLGLLAVLAIRRSS